MASPCSYFAQILEQRGPLKPEDPLLVGELHNFPSEAQLKIQEAGGIEPFLLASMRFRKMGMFIALTPAALEQWTGGGVNLSHPDFQIPDYSSYASSSRPVLPNPHETALGVNVPAAVENDEGLLDFSQVEDPYSSFNKEDELNADQAELSGNSSSACGVTGAEGVSLSHRVAAVQVGGINSLVVLKSEVNDLTLIPNSCL